MFQGWETDAGRMALALMGLLAGLFVVLAALGLAQRRWGDRWPAWLRVPRLGSLREARRRFLVLFVLVVPVAALSLWRLNRRKEEAERHYGAAERALALQMKVKDAEELCQALLSDDAVIRLGAANGLHRLLHPVKRGDRATHDPAWCQALAHRVRSWLAANREGLRFDETWGMYFWRDRVPQEDRARRAFVFHPPPAGREQDH